MDRFKLMDNSWLGRSWIALCVTGLMSLTVLPAQQGTQGSEPRESSFPGIGSKSVEAPAEPAKSHAKQAVESAKQKAPEAVLYETTAEVGLRSIPNTEVAPVIKGRLPKGTLLWLLLKEDGTEFTRVSIVGGFQGYVFAKYGRPDGQGMVEITRPKVAFRAKPSTKGWPIDQCRQGTLLPLLSREGDWFKVLSNPEIGALVPDAKIRKISAITIRPGGELASFAEGSDLAKRAEAQYTSRQAPWTAVREKRIADAKRQGHIIEIRQEIRDLRSKMAVETERSDEADMDLSQVPVLLASIQKHVKAIDPTDPGLVSELAAVEAEAEQLRLVAQARKLINEPTPKPTPVMAKPASAKRGFVQSGWVRYRPGGYSSFQLVKGGEILCYLVCDTRRYNLKDYVGCELGLRGRVGPREGADFKVMDVSRIHVLSSR